MTLPSAASMPFSIFRGGSLLQCRPQQTGIVCGTTSGTLTEKTTGGQMITGSDSVVTVGCK